MFLLLDQSPSPQAASQATTRASDEQQFHHPDRFKRFNLLMKSPIGFEDALLY